MGTTYEVLKKIEDTLDFGTLLKKGIIPFSLINKKMYYEYYRKELSLGRTNWQSVTNTAEEFNVCEMTVRRAIKQMES